MKSETANVGAMFGIGLEAGALDGPYGVLTAQSLKSRQKLRIEQSMHL